MAINIWIFIVKCIFCIGFMVANVEAMIGGNVQNVQQNEFPYVTSIIKAPRSRNGSFRHLCTGTLVSKQDVLTIGHCLEEERLSRIQIMVGSVSLNAGLRFYPMYWKFYNDWAARRNLPCNSIIDDIAMIRLTDKIPSVIPTAVLWYIQRSDLIGLDVRSAGWGSSHPYTTANTMKKIYVKILSDNDAKDRVIQILRHEIIMDRKLLYTASNEHSLLQHGDSGGPLLHGNMLIGVNIGTTPLQGRFVVPLTMNIHFNVLEFRMFIEEFLSEEI